MTFSPRELAAEGLLAFVRPPAFEAASAAAGKPSLGFAVFTLPPAPGLASRSAEGETLTPLRLYLLSNWVEFTRFCNRFSSSASEGPSRPVISA